MQVIYKQTLQDGRNFINLRGRNAKILSIQPQGDCLSVWYQTHNDHIYPSSKRVELFVVYTGEKFEQDLPYVATYQTNTGVLHLYGELK